MRFVEAVRGLLKAREEMPVAASSAVEPLEDGSEG
jgi:hypothetical protein